MHTHSTEEAVGTNGGWPMGEPDFLRPGMLLRVCFFAAVLLALRETDVLRADEIVASRANRQVEIEARFIELTHTVVRRLQPAQRDANGPLTAIELLGSAFRGGKNAQCLDANQAIDFSNASGITLLSAPRVTARSGQRAVIEIVREFRYATDWERNEKKERWIPVQYETRNCGVTLEVEADVAENGCIMLKLVPQAVEFLGFRDRDTGKATAGDAETVRADAVFSTRKVAAELSVPAGGSVLIGPMPETEETRPFKVPRKGRHVIALVTAKVIN